MEAQSIYDWWSLYIFTKKENLSILLNLEVDRHPAGKLLIHGPNTTQTTRYKAWSSPAEYAIRECKHDTKEFHNNAFNPVFTKKVRAKEHH